MDNKEVFRINLVRFLWAKAAGKTSVDLQRKAGHPSIYTGENAVIKLNAGILPRAAEEDKREKA